MTTIKATAHGFPAEIPGLEDELLRGLYATAVTRREEVLTAFEERRRAIAGDAGLTQLGKAQALAEAAADSARRLAGLPGETDDLEQLGRGIGINEAKLLAPRVRHALPAGVDPEDARWSEREARDEIRRMDPIERRALYLQACESGDYQTVRAFELAPSAFPLVDADTLAEGADRWAQHTDPKLWQQLEDQRQTLSMLEYVQGEAVKEFERAAGAAAPKPENEPVILPA